MKPRLVFKRSPVSSWWYCYVVQEYGLMWVGRGKTMMAAAKVLAEPVGGK